VALLNDSKYGHRVKDGILDLNLLRSVPYPGYNTAVHQPVAEGEPHPGYTDQADHVFSYALFPHPGDIAAGGVIQAGYEFNIPLRQAPVDAHPGALPPAASFLTVDSPNVIVEAIKKAEDSRQVVIRLYESQNAGAHANIRFGFKINSAAEATLMEEPVKALEVTDDSVRVTFLPFEIKTLMIEPT
jgi:alpha-mannosidase